MNSLNPRTEKLAPIRVTPEELATIKRLATAARLTVSDYVRRRALSCYRQPRTPGDGSPMRVLPD